MIHIKMFENFEGNNSLFSICDRLIGDSEIWKRNRERVKSLNPDFELKQINVPVIDASFNSNESSKNNIVIEVGPGNVDDSTMAHELIHALQFIERGELEIFTQDATREFSVLSDDEDWEYFMFAIYMSDELEAEAQKAELKFGLQKQQKAVMDWIKMNTPEKIAKKISLLIPDENEFDLESFDEFPDLWVSVYLNYTDIEIDKYLAELKDKSLLEFVAYYYLKFSSFVRYMES